MVKPNTSQMLKDLTINLLKHLHEQGLNSPQRDITWDDLKSIDGGYEAPSWLVQSINFQNLFTDFDGGFVRAKSPRDAISKYYPETFTLSVDGDTLELKYQHNDNLKRVTKIQKETYLTDDPTLLNALARDFASAIISLY